MLMALAGAAAAAATDGRPAQHFVMGLWLLWWVLGVGIRSVGRSRRPQGMQASTSPPVHDGRSSRVASRVVARTTLAKPPTVEMPAASDPPAKGLPNQNSVWEPLPMFCSGSAPCRMRCFRWMDQSVDRFPSLRARVDRIDARKSAAWCVRKIAAAAARSIRASSFLLRKRRPRLSSASYCVGAGGSIGHRLFFWPAREGHAPRVSPRWLVGKAPAVPNRPPAGP